MEFETAEGAIISKEFPLTLEGASMVWFTSLRPRTIRSFKKLEDAFTAQFLGARPVKKLLSHLSFIVPREWESLKV